MPTVQWQHVSRVIPIERRKGVNNFDQLLRLTQEYNLLFGEKGRGIIRKNATDENGVFSSNWKGMTSIQQAALSKAVHEREPWMGPVAGSYFQRAPATLSHLIIF